jgi:hypothetical protein
MGETFADRRPGGQGVVRAAALLGQFRLGGGDWQILHEALGGVLDQRSGGFQAAQVAQAFSFAQVTARRVGRQVSHDLEQRQRPQRIAGALGYARLLDHQREILGEQRPANQDHLVGEAEFRQIA